MKPTKFCSASLLMLAAAMTAHGQVVVDGRLSDGENDLYTAQWFQTNPTQFGDCRVDNQSPCNPIGQGVVIALNNSNTGGVSGGSASGGDTVTTGVEYKIPLSQIGNPAGAIRIAGFVNAGCHCFLSNQVIGGASGAGNFGGPGGVNFNGVANDQFITVPAGGGECTEPTMDGTLDSAYGAPLFVQDTATGFGDASSGNIDFTSGSEIDAAYGYICNGNLYLFLAGNLESNFNKMDLFIDSVAGGQSTLRGDNPDVDFNGLNAMAGLQFDSAFESDLYIQYTCGDTNGGDPGGFATFASVAETLTGGGGRGSYIGSGGAGTTVLNSQVICPPTVPDYMYSFGSEIDGVLAYLDEPNNRLYVLVTGNFDVNGNKLNLFWDVISGEGQNTIRGDNVNISVADGNGGSLNRMGTGNELPGLTFDEAFSPDYFMNFHYEGGSSFGIYRNVLDSAVLRTTGRDRNFLGNSLDYGGFSGLDATNNPIPYNATNFCCVGGDSDIQGRHGVRFQDGLTADLYSSFAPRHARTLLDDAYAAGVVDVEGFNSYLLNGADGQSGDQRIPGLIVASCDNSNVAGVTDTDASGAPSATTGLEISVDLAELGVSAGGGDERGALVIKMAGFITSGNFTFMSNQVIGGLPEGTGNLAEVRSVNFASLAGDQYITLDFTPPPSDGACCVDRCTCIIATPSGCEESGGVFQGVGTTCGEAGQCFPNPACACDVNGVDGLDSQDFFDFLDLFFATDPAADINCADGVDSQDYFDFIECFFGGSCAG